MNHGDDGGAEKCLKMTAQTALYRAAFRRMQYIAGVAYYHYLRSGRQAYQDRAEALVAKYDELYDLCQWR